ncbi:hypothetical protein [Edaphobacter sp.]|uniref:hypothetical protein n=1 Tax=Edaphobacter sp. TaxID=1934404 RepID=UPI002DB74679|nr:hypothetical protein [Edaphobacter sp.]HEU5339646.1 hypothetical protein [Edaphobacter sp.]
MATLPELKMLLYRIQGELMKQPVFVRGKGVPVDDPSHSREMEELERLSLRLSLVLRELKSSANLLAAQRQGLWNVPRPERFGAAAAIRSRQMETDEVLRLAREIQELLEELIRRNGQIEEGELAKGIGELIEKLYHQAHVHGETQQIPDGLAYMPAARGEYAGSVEGVTLFVFVALRAWLRLMKQRR